jgi:hypothetical protein
VLGDLAIGRSITRGKYESGLSVRLRPPAKWSYGRLLRFAGLIAIVSLIVCVRVVMSSASVVSGSSITMAGAAELAAFAVGLFAIWRRNQFIYPRQLAEWERLLLCQRCGGVSSQGLG